VDDEQEVGTCRVMRWLNSVQARCIALVRDCSRTLRCRGRAMKPRAPELWRSAAVSRTYQEGKTMVHVHEPSSAYDLCA
jgi:hypothetical protein